MVIDNGGNRNSQVLPYRGANMAGPRHQHRELASKEKVSITLDKDVFDFIEHGVRMRWWPSRSAGINFVIAQFIQHRNHSGQNRTQQPPQQPPQSQGMMGGYPHSVPREPTGRP